MALSGAPREKKPVEPFDRGINTSKSVFIPKGSIGAGVSLSYHNYSLGNGLNDTGYKMLFSLLQNIHGNMLSFGVAPYVSYFIADNLSIGARFNYDRSMLGLGNLDISLGDAMSLNLNDFNFFRQSYTGSVTLRNYMPIAESKRFALFAELRATGGYAQSETYRMDENDKFGTYQDIYQFELGVVAGVMAFVTNEVALEVSIGQLGFDYQKVVQVTNQVERSEMEKSGANFRINLLSLSFGLSFYIPTGQHRVKKSK
ncbi:hypothetical protein EVA_07288 [gut metagenome]|uniref:Outer membrane protein beta-barrel domain-containing protein n=1 Tax=gut metagenome TaxID=749906 RepID=J9GVN1_9ZZZZ